MAIEIRQKGQKKLKITSIVLTLKAAYILRYKKSCRALTLLLNFLTDGAEKLPTHLRYTVIIVQFSAIRNKRDQEL